MHRIQDRAFYARDARKVAKDLLGSLLVRRVDGEKLILRITETECYLGPEDLASHARGGRITERNRVMFGDAGHVYMFLIYGMHHCFNITAGVPGKPEAVLIRSGEAVLGTHSMMERRGLGEKQLSEKRKFREIASGPGKLSQALGLTMEQNGLDLTDEWDSQMITLAQDGFAADPSRIQADARIGIDYAGEFRDKPWRYYLKENDTVSITKEKRIGKIKSDYDIQTK